MSKKPIRKCIECNIFRKIYGRGRCSGCYKRNLKKGLPNDYEPIYVRSGQFKTGNKPINSGIPLSEERKKYLSKLNYGKNNPRWEGKYARSHHTYRKEVENLIGKKLNDGEVIHHKNGNTFNNSKENVIIFKNHSEHMKYHWQKQKSNNQKGRFKKFQKKMKNGEQL